MRDYIELTLAAICGGGSVWLAIHNLQFIQW